jgi:hypothetical protein
MKPGTGFIDKTIKQISVIREQLWQALKHLFVILVGKPLISICREWMEGAMTSHPRGGKEGCW